MRHTVCAERILRQALNCFQPNWIALPLLVMLGGDTVAPMTIEAIPALTHSELLGREIKAWLVRRGLKQSDIAETLGIVQSGVSHRLRGRTPFTIDQLIQIAGLLDVTLGELLPTEVLNAQGPRSATRNEGLQKLPRLDSNQQPSG